MPTLPGMVLQVVEASWNLSLEFLPFLYLAFMGDALGRENSTGYIDTVVWSQRSYTLHYGIYIVAGLILGSLSMLALGGTPGLIVGGAVAAATAIYAYREKGSPERKRLDLAYWNDRLKTPWLLVPLLCVAALATGNILLKSLVALVFLSAVFWEV